MATEAAGGAPASERAGLLFDIADALDSARAFGRAEIEAKLPHRGRLLFIDEVLWTSSGFERGVAVHHVGRDEFWAEDHFPGDPMMPGVLMVEAGAQLACFLHNCRLPRPVKPAFVRIDDTSFRNIVRPGDDLYLLCSKVRWTPRRFQADIQGVVNGRIAFMSRVAGVQL
jgi:3-hydroxyacyl-[acyl-carrier-protein] dehydratase